MRKRKYGRWVKRSDLTHLYEHRETGRLLAAVYRSDPKAEGWKVYINNAANTVHILGDLYEAKTFVELSFGIT